MSTTESIGNLRDANFPWIKLCFRPTYEKLKLALENRSNEAIDEADEEAPDDDEDVTGGCNSVITSWYNRPPK